MIEYLVSAARPAQHLIEVRIRATAKGRDHVDFRMPAWRPGRYQIANFAGRVQEFHSGGRDFFRTDKDTWRVRTDGASTVEVSYSCYANKLDAGSSLLNHEELYVNPINTLMAVGTELSQPCSLSIQVPSGWRLAVPLARQGEGWRALDYHELVDSPFLASPTLTTATFEEAGVRCHVHIQGDGNYDLSKITEDLARIVREQVAMMGHSAATEYHFLYHLVGHKMSHGVEHSASTSIVIGPATDFDQEAFYDRFLSVSSHEFFHVWNVKRFRPHGLVPYDYWREACTPLLYVAEGFTSYYGDLTLARCELWSRNRYFQALAEEVQSLRNAPGHRVTTLEAASWDVWTAGYGNAPPTSAMSFYNKGELVAWLLDLEIRRRSQGTRSLDDCMRLLDRAFGATEKGYTPQDFAHALAEAAGCSMDDVLEKCTRVADGLPIEEMLENTGLSLVQGEEADKPESRLGAYFEERAGETVVSRLVADGPAETAGLEDGDVLLALNGHQASSATLVRLLKPYAVGDKVKLTVFRGRRLREVTVTLQSGLVSTYSITHREPMPPADRRFLDAWLAACASAARVLQ